MASFEPVITEILLYSDDDFIKHEIKKKNFLNIKLYRTNEIKVKNTSEKLDFSFDLEYFHEEIVQSIIGDKINDMIKESSEICFVSSKEEFIKLQNFKGIVICLESSYVDAIRTNNIVVKEKEQALSIIYSLYYSLNSYHIVPYDLDMLIEYDFNIIIEKIDTMQADESNIIVWNYRNINSNEDLNVIFINTKDCSIREFKGVDLYDKMVGKINKKCIDGMENDSEVAMNYTLEIGDE